MCVVSLEEEMQQEKLPIIMVSIIEREKGKDGAGERGSIQNQKKMVDEALATLVLLPDGGKILYESSQHAAYYPLSLSRGKAAVIMAVYCWLQRRYAASLFILPFLSTHTFDFTLCALLYCNAFLLY